MKVHMKENIQRIWDGSLKCLKSLMRNFVSVQTDNTDKTDKAIFATFATFATFAMQIFHKGSYSAVRAMSVQQPTNLQRISNLSPTVRPIYNRFTTNSVLSRLCLASLILMSVGTGNAWGEDNVLSNVDLGQKWTTYAGEVIAETDQFVNTDGITEISYTYNAFNAAGDQVFLVEYSLNGTDYFEWNTKPEANNGVVNDPIPTNHPARNAVRFRFVAQGAPGQYGLWGLWVRKAPLVAQIPGKGLSASKHGVTFNLSGRYSTYSDYGYTKEGNTMTLSWAVPTGYNISVTSIWLRCQEQKNGGRTYYSSTKNSNETQVNIHQESGGFQNLTLNASYFPLGNDDRVYFRADKNEFNYKEVEFTYTLAANTYTISFDGNGSTKGSVDNISAIYDQNVTLASNNYRKHQYIVTYNANGGTCSKSVDSTLYTFQGWNTNTSGTGTNYTAGATLTKPNFTSTNGDTYTLHAKWSSTPANTTVILPTPTHADPTYTFVGWYVSTDEDQTIIGVGGSSYTPTSDVTLKAKWSSVRIPYFSGASQSLLVGETYSGFEFNNTSTETPSASEDDNFYYVITTTTVPTGNRAGSSYPNDVISISGNTITALNNGVATIKFYQKEDGTNNIAAGESDTYTITVNRNTVPDFTWNTRDHYFYNENIAHFFKANHSANAEVTMSSTDADVAIIQDSALVVYNKNASTTITMTQAENYYWNTHSESKVITPEKPSNHVPFTYSEEMFGEGSTVNSITITKQSDLGLVWSSTNNCVCLGNEDDDWFHSCSSKYDDKHVVIKFEGIPDSISFEIATNSNQALSEYFYLRESADGKTWSGDIWHSDKDGRSFQAVDVPYPLAKTTRYIRIGYSGNFSGYFKDLTITQYKQFETDSTSFDFKTQIKNANVPSKSFKFKHANAGYTVTATSSDATHYKVSLNAAGPWSESVVIPNTGGDRMGTQDIYVKYYPVDAATHNATITLSDPLGNSKTVNVTGVTQAQLATHLVYLGEEEYDATQSNIGVAALFEVRDDNNALVDDAVITLSRDDAYSVLISIVDNSLQFDCSGTAKIKAHYDGDETYAPDDEEVEIQINKVADAIVWNGVGEDGKIHVWADGSIPNTVANGHGGIATYSSNSSLLTVGGSMGSYTLTTGRASGLPQEVTLTATSAGDCQYNPATESKTVVIEPCTHRIVWDQDFSQLLLDEFGNISYSQALNAYAVDSMGTRTGVAITYSIEDNGNKATLQNGNTLVVQGRVETMLTATTVASDKYAQVTESRPVRVLQWGENRATINGSQWEANRDWTGPHVRFHMDAPNGSYDGTFKELDIDANENNTISWTVDPGCSITVTSIDLGIGYAAPFIGVYCKLYINDVEKKEFWTTTGSNFSYSGYTLGNNDNIVLKTSRDVDLYNVSLVYTLTPTVVPTVVAGETPEVNVTVDEDAKQILDLRSYFSLEEGMPDDFELEYEVVNANGHAFIADGYNFWADAAGDYQVRARVKAAVDHRPSAWSSETKTIRVNRLSNTLYANGSNTYSATMNMRSTLDVAFTATNTDYEGSPISCEQTAGTGLMSYNPSAGQIESGEVLGSATWRISQPQNSQYLAGETTFTVTLVNNTFVFNGGTNTDWGTTSNWADETKPTANDNVTVTGNLVIDEEIEVYSLNVEDENAVVTIAPNGGLTVGAGGITGATVENLILKAGTEGVTKGQTGYLRISPRVATMPEATVELFSIGYYDRGTTEKNVAAWQLVGSPIDFDGKLAKTVYTRSWIYSYLEASDSWKNNRSTLVMQPFVGYKTTQYDSEDGKLLTYAGELVPNDEYEYSLAYSGEEFGHNIVANSFAAPIDITKFEIADFVNAEPSIYIYNTGSKTDAVNNGGANGNKAGQWTAISIGTVEEMNTFFGENTAISSTIAPMQGFCVNATEDDAKLVFNYDRLVWNADYSAHQPKPLRAPKRSESEDEQPITGAMKITLSADGWSDNVYFLESEKYDVAFEDGFDAHKMESGTLNIFAVEDEHKLAIDATNSIVGTRVGVRTGEETAYTMTFNYIKGDYVLWDIDAEEQVAISEGQTYTFFAEPNSEITSRFVILEAEAPSVATGIDEATSEGAKVRKFIKDEKVYILKNGVIYDVTGKRVK